MTLFNKILGGLLIGCLLLSVSCEGGDINADPGYSSGSDLICHGDPDSVMTCVPKNDLWSCEILPNGNQKCVRPDEQDPDGNGGWGCTHDGDHLVCVTESSDVQGNGDWDCVNSKKKTTCTSNSDHDVPPGGGSWNCIAEEMTIICETQPVSTPPNNTPLGPPNIEGDICFIPDPEGETGGLPTDMPATYISMKTVSVDGTPVLRARVTYNPTFCDNTYGENSIGWGNSKKGTHQFKELVGSDHVVLRFDDCEGNSPLTTKIDYISEDESSSSGYRSLGVTGGDGKVLDGDASAVVAVRTSLDVNFNVFGYVLTTDSPATDNSYSSNAQVPNWIWNMWYEIDIRLDAFGSAGACGVWMDSLHASPSKVGSNTIELIPSPCP